MDIIETILLRALLSFLIIGGFAGLIIGIALIMDYAYNFANPRWAGATVA